MQNMSHITPQSNNDQIDSRFRLVVLVGLRMRQLIHGSKPRIEGNLGKRKVISIALEEVTRGLVKVAQPATDGHADVALIQSGLVQASESIQLVSRLRDAPHR